MLSPDTLQNAGDAVAALYSDMEAAMLEHLVGELLSVDRLGQRSVTELNLLAQSMTSDLRRIIEENRSAIADEVYETCERCLSASDKDDAARLGTDDVTFPQQLAATVAGLQLVLDRDNLKMVEGAKQAFLKASVEAVSMTNSGLYTSEQAIHKAVRNLTTSGIGVTEVTYQNPKTGAVTVTNKVDVAVRRHVRTQIAQDSGRMTLDLLKQMDVALVEVSSHEGSRPSHAEWQGRCYSLKGEVVIEGKRYPDFYASTGYGSVDGLLGANCVIGDTLVGGPAANTAYRREYSGEIITIHTASGHELTITPKHPILTPRGWVDAGSLAEGDHVLATVVGDRVPACVGPDKDKGPSPIRQVFEALGDTFGVHALFGSAGHFHGDGIADSQVDIVFTDGLLRRDWQACFDEHIPESLLHNAAKTTGSLLASSAFHEVGFGPLHASNRVMGRLGVRHSFLYGHPSVPRPAGIAPAFGGIAVLGESLTDDHVPGAHQLGDGVLGDTRLIEADDLGIVERQTPSVAWKTQFRKPLPNHLPADAEVVGDFLLRHSCVVEFDEVTEVKVDSRACHVYNLQTEGGWYFANGIVTYNCRHSFGPYRHGAPRVYEPDPKHPSGLSNDEVYRLTQKQRYHERQIRAAKRDIMGAQKIYEKDPSLPNRTNLMQAQERLKSRQAAMRTLIKDANAKCKPGTTVLHRNPRREWAGDMPKTKSKASLVAEGKVTKKSTANQYSVKRRIVNGEAYKERIKQLGLPKKASATLHQQALRILEDTDGTQHERLCAISWRTGEPVTDTFAHPPVRSACGFTPEQVAKIADVEGGVILLHNHPGSSVPSATDILTLANNDWCRASVIACHDGTLYMPRVLKDGVSEAYNKILNDTKNANLGISDSGTLEQIAQEVFYLENEDERWFKLTKK